MSTATSSPATHAEDREGQPLLGLDGSNPLGFLAALGTLQIVSSANPGLPITMSWIVDSLGFRPRIHHTEGDLPSICNQIASHLGCPFRPDEHAERSRLSALERFEEARRRLQQAQQAFKKRGLKGKERQSEEERVVEPLRKDMASARNEWLDTLGRCVPSPELALGKHLNATCAELREASARALSEANATDREIVDLFASFGSDACRVKTGEVMQCTAFCFITGSGHQYFLDTARQLIEKVDARRLAIALSQNIEPSDERLSMRWDPLEDRRYSLMWSDPTSSDNVAKTNWAVNLLAYRGIGLIPAVPTANGLRTSGWTSQDQASWTWPIWRGCATTAVVRSLLAHPDLAAEELDSRRINALGIRAVYRSRRIQVGQPPLHKVNFTPAHRIA